MVFTNDLDRVKHPLRSRVRGIAIGTLVMGLVCAALVSPRTIPYALPLIAAAAALIGTGRTSIFQNVVQRTYVFPSIVGFLAWIAMSAMWASAPDAPIGPVLKSFGFLAAGAVIVEVIRLERRSNVFHLAEGLWIGLIVGLVYLLVEILSGQAIKLAIYNFLELTKSDLRPSRYFTWHDGVLLSISPFDLTRNIAPVSLFLWAALLCMIVELPSTAGRAARAAVFVTAALVIGFSEHETSKLALVVSTAIFLLAKQRPVWSLNLLRAAWVASCLAIIPVSLAMHRADLHNAHWLQDTGRHRIIIWNHTAEEAMKSPILGVGAGVMYRTGSAPAQKRAGEDFQYNVPHAHNIYLQTWYELGAFGAALLTLIGLAILERIARYSTLVSPYAQATFASSMVMAAASYGMWQPWFIAMFISAVCAFAIGVRLEQREELNSGDDPEPARRDDASSAPIA